MVLGPHSMLQSRKSVILEVEKVLDAKLRESKATSTYLTFDVKLFPHVLSVGEWSTLLKRYVQSGWVDAQYIHDQRDGNYIQLTPPTEP